MRICLSFRNMNLKVRGLGHVFVVILISKSYKISLRFLVYEAINDRYKKNTGRFIREGSKNTFPMFDFEQVQLSYIRKVRSFNRHPAIRRPQHVNISKQVITSVKIGQHGGQL